MVLTGRQSDGISARFALGALYSFVTGVANSNATLLGLGKIDSPSAPARFGKPAAARKVGSTSIPLTKCSLFALPAFTTPVQRTGVRVESA